MEKRDDILISVRGRRATLKHTVALNTGNAGSYRVRFLVDPKDPAWADKSLSATFRAVTHRGAVITAIAPIDPRFTAKIPAKVLRVPAARLEVSLKGVASDETDVSTNMVNTGPVEQGAGGDGIFDECGPQNPWRSGPVCAQGRPDCAEQIWRFMMAKFAGMDPFLRELQRFMDGFGERAGVDENGAPTWDGEAWPCACREDPSEPPVAPKWDGGFKWDAGFEWG